MKEDIGPYQIYTLLVVAGLISGDHLELEKRQRRFSSKEGGFQSSLCRSPVSKHLFAGYRFRVLIFLLFFSHSHCRIAC